MGADHRVGAAGVALVHVREQRPVDVVAVVHGGQAIQIGLHPLRQGVIGGVHAGEHGVAAHRRDGRQVQDRAHRRLGVAGQVRVPVLAGHVLGGLVGMDGHHLGMVGQARDAGVDDQFAERAAERLVALVVEVLVAEEDHLVLSDGLGDLLQLAVGRLAQVDAEDLGPDPGRHRNHFQHFIGHGLSFRSHRRVYLKFQSGSPSRRRDCRHRPARRDAGSRHLPTGRTPPGRSGHRPGRCRPGPWATGASA